MKEDCSHDSLASQSQKRQRIGAMTQAESDDEQLVSLLGGDNDEKSGWESASPISDGSDWDSSDDLEKLKPVEIHAAQQRATSSLAALSDVAQTALVDALSGPVSGHSMEFPKRRARVKESMNQGSMNMQCDFNVCNQDLESRSSCFSSLKEHQRIGVRWMLALSRCVPGMVLADEMGLGKTLQTLCFLEILASTRPSLVLAPASLLDNWVAEAKRWTPKVLPLKYHGFNTWERRELQKALHDQAYQLVIATSQAVHCKEDQSFFLKTLFEYVVLDEAHCLKRTTTAQHRNLIRIKCRRRLLLTGTPVQNSLSELATLLGFALHNQHDPSASISKEVASHLRKISQKSPVEAVHQFKTAAAPFIMRRLKVDVLRDLPPKRGEVVYCEMEGEQLEQYQAELNACSNRYSAMTNVMEAFLRLRRICLHPLLRKLESSDSVFSEFIDHLIRCRAEFQNVSRVHVEREVSGWSEFQKHKVAKEHDSLARFSVPNKTILQVAKMSSLLQILRKQISQGNKTLVFSQFTQVLDIVEEALRLVGIGFCRMDGATAIADRHSIVSSFQGSPGSFVFLMTTKTGGVGLNITTANVVVMFDLDFNPQNTRQAEDRVHRLGQKQEVIVYYLICRGTVEEMVLRRNCNKLQLDAQFGARQAALELALTDGKEIATLDDIPLCKNFVQGKDQQRESDTITGDGSAECKACIQQVTTDLKDLLLHNSQSLLSTAELYQILPEDAPPTHIAHSQIKYDPRDERYSFVFHYPYVRQKVHFQSTVKQAGSRIAAQIIARVCYLRFECGWTKNRVKMFRQECYEKLMNARAQKSAHQINTACKEQANGTCGDSLISYVSCKSEEDSDTSTEWAVLPSACTASIASTMVTNLSGKGTPKKRGRPPNPKQQTAGGVIGSPKARGRPEKQKQERVGGESGSLLPERTQTMQGYCSLDNDFGLDCPIEPFEFVASLGSDDELASDTSTEVVLVSRECPPHLHM